MAIDNYESFTKCIVDFNTHIIKGNVKEIPSPMKLPDYEFWYQDGGGWPTEGGEDSLWLLTLNSDEFDAHKSAVDLIEKSLSDFKNYLENRYESVSIDVELANHSENETTPNYIIRVVVSFRYAKLDSNALSAAIRERDRKIEAELAQIKAKEEAELAKEEAELAKEEAELARIKAEEEAELARLQEIENKKQNNYNKFKDYIVNEIGNFELPIGDSWRPIRDLFRWNDDEFCYDWWRAEGCTTGRGRFDGTTASELHEHKINIFNWAVADNVREPHSS